MFWCFHHRHTFYQYCASSRFERACLEDQVRECQFFVVGEQRHSRLCGSHRSAVVGVGFVVVDVQFIISSVNGCGGVVKWNISVVVVDDGEISSQITERDQVFK